MKKMLFLACFSFSFLSAAPFSNGEEMLLYIKNYLPENPVILEAGGHHGEDTKRMKALWPKSIQYVFEPLPKSFEKLSTNTKDLANVNRFPYALSDHVGKASFYYNPQNDGASSIGSPVYYNESEFEKVPLEVQCITLDEWAKKNGITHIDFMWLDMEGHELYALENASTILDSVKAIFTEINFVHTRNGACLYTDLKAFLESKGFKEVHKLDYHRFGDALFMR